MTYCKRIIIHLNGWNFYHHEYNELNSLEELSDSLGKAILDRFEGKRVLHDIRKEDDMHTCVLLEMYDKRKYSEYKMEIQNI